MDEQQAQAPDLREYLAILSKRFWMIVIVFVAIFFTAVGYVSSLPRIYEAISAVLLETPVETRYIVGVRQQQQAGGQVQSAPGMVSLDTAARLVKSRLQAEITAQRIREDYPKLKGSISPDEVLGSITTETIDPDEIRIHARSEDPAKARAIANAAANVFVDENRKSAVREATSAREFLEKVLSKTKKDYEEAQNNITKFEQKEGILDIDSQVAAYAQQTASYDTEKAKVEAEIESAKSYLGTLQSHLASTAPQQKIPTIEQNPLATQLRERLVSLELDLINAKAKYTANNPKIAELQDQVKGVQQKLTEAQDQVVETVTQQPNQDYLQLRQQVLTQEAQVAQLEAQSTALDRARDAVSKEVAKLPPVQQQLQNMVRLQKVAEDTYTALLDRLQDARIDEAVKQGNGRLGDIAGLPTVPVSPQPKRMLLFAGVLGLAAALGLAFLLEYLDTTIKTPDDIEKHVGIPALGFIPAIEGTKDSILVTRMESKSPISEAYRTLRSNIKYTCLDSPLRSLLVTSAGTGEGKSITCANLGIVMAEGGQRVILVDCDLRRPTLHRHFGVAHSVGVTNVLAAEAPIDDVLIDTEVSGLRLVASGPLPPNPSELIDSARFTKFLEDLQTRADLIIIDSPPALVVTDAAVLAERVDGCLLVAEAGGVAREAAVRLREIIEKARGRAIGAVLNKVRILGVGSYYYHYYYHYYYYSYYYYGSERGGRRKRRSGQRQRKAS